MKLLIPFRLLRWWRWLFAVNVMIKSYKDNQYYVPCPLCTSSTRSNCTDCLWLRFEGRKCQAGSGLEDNYQQRVRRLRRWKVRMIYGKKASEAWARKEENA